MAFFAISASCHAQYSQPVPEIKFPFIPRETSLQLFCGYVSPYHHIAESEDSHV